MFFFFKLRLAVSLTKNHILITDVCGHIQTSARRVGVCPLGGSNVNFIPSLSRVRGKEKAVTCSWDLLRGRGWINICVSDILQDED